MYRYDGIDKTLVEERVAQFRDQTRRFLAGELTEDEFRHLRLRNGLYIQRHAPMLRVAIPYGLLSSTQLRALGSIARRYDRGYGHFTTRQNIQYNWPRLEDVPEILAELRPWKCTRFKRAAIAFAIRPRTRSRGSRPTSWRILGRGAKSSGSG